MEGAHAEERGMHEVERADAHHQTQSLIGELEHERSMRQELERQLAEWTHENGRLKILAMDSQEKAEELEVALSEEVVARIHAEEEQGRLAKQRDQLDSELSFLVEEIAVMKEAMMSI
eukprot:TRINITY_DN20642_c0_g1_i1.p2 TRINITY_DN20642_c0_g1~~TRINITY_DN20642_c0_g1_i1.p2  ORF type:complete len:118 (+),score=36.98 TRINITY_DN20642_c0_g1_i1:323-676(+)